MAILRDTPYFEITAIDVATVAAHRQTPAGMAPRRNLDALADGSMR
jgi:hypothetical protein